MHLCSNKLTSKYGKRVVLVFLYILYKAWRKLESSFCHSFFRQVCFEKKTALRYWFPSIFFVPCISKYMPSVFFVPCISKSFTCLYTGLRKKPFWFIYRINSFQDQNTCQCNFNLIINNSRLFNSNIIIDTYLNQ